MAGSAKAQEVCSPASTTDAINLYGAYRFKVDDKGRVSLPSKFRKMLPSKLVVAPSVENKCLSVFVGDGYDEWIKRLFRGRYGEFNEASRQQTELHTVLKGRASDVDVDGSGRIMLSAEARAKVGIEKDVVIVGETGRFDIYDAKRYDAMVEKVEASLANILLD